MNTTDLRPEGNQPDMPPSPHHKPSVVQASTISALVMILLGVIVATIGKHEIAPIFSLPSTWKKAELVLGSGCLSAGVLLVLVYFFSEWFGSYRIFLFAVGELLGRLTWPILLYVSLVSALGEELLFRGALQPTMGLALSSVLFVFAHTGREGPFTPWALWSLIFGAMLGWIHEGAGSIWAPVSAHFLFNIVLGAILKIRRRSLVPAAQAGAPGTSLQ